MPRTAQQTEEPQITAEALTADGAAPEPTVAAPTFDMAQLQEMVSGIASKVLIDQLMAVLPSMVSAQTASQNGPTPVTKIGLMENAPVKSNVLKHYRMDDVVSGKYQLIDVSKLDENGEIPFVHQLQAAGHYKTESPAVMKGEWVHFQNDTFYATRPIEVAYVEWRIATDPQFRAYEVKKDIGQIVCSVGNCNKRFADEETLAAHMRATHGV